MQPILSQMFVGAACPGACFYISAGMEVTGTPVSVILMDERTLLAILCTCNHVQKRGIYITVSRFITLNPQTQKRGYHFSNTQLLTDTKYNSKWTIAKHYTRKSFKYLYIYTYWHI